MTGAAVAAEGVHARSVLRAVVRSFETFIHIDAFFATLDEAIIAEAIVRAFSVDAGSVLVAIVLLVHALVNVQTVTCSAQQSVLEESVFAFAVVPAFLIHTERVPATVVQPVIGTFIHILAGFAVSSESRLTDAVVRAKRVNTTRVLVARVSILSALVDIRARFPIANEARHARARVAAGCVAATRIAAAHVSFSALVDVDTSIGLTVERESLITFARERTDCVRARAVFNAVVGAGNTLVNVRAALAVTAEASIARTAVREKSVCTNRVVAAARGGLALVYVFTDDAVSLRASSAAANMASSCILTICVFMALMTSCRALININANLSVATEARLAGASVARVVV